MIGNNWRRDSASCYRAAKHKEEQSKEFRRVHGRTDADGRRSSSAAGSFVAVRPSVRPSRLSPSLVNARPPRSQAGGYFNHHYSYANCFSSKNECPSPFLPSHSFQVSNAKWPWTRAGRQAGRQEGSSTRVRRERSRPRPSI